MNWLIIQGLELHGFGELTARLVLENGFYEYFDPLI
jgi:hypothetical protein